jgi:iron(III) transport system ATP-binding protein
VLEVRDDAGKVELGGALILDIALPAGTSIGESVEVAIRPENIRLAKPTNGVAARGKITERTFLGNISEYYATLDSGQMLRVQTHPQQAFAIDEPVVIEIDASHCSVFRNSAAPPASYQGVPS